MKAIERIVNILKKKDLNHSSVEKKLSLSNGYISTMFKRKGSLGEDMLQKFSEALDIDIDYLVTGKHCKVETIDSIVSEPQASYENKSLPLLTIDAIAGHANGDVQVMQYETERFIIPTFKGADYLISIRGASMVPKYNSGDIVACKRLPLDTFFQWNQVYVLDTEQGPLIKKVCKSEQESHILLVSENKDFPAFEISLKKVRSIAIVLGVIRLE